MNNLIELIIVIAIISILSFSTVRVGSSLLDKAHDVASFDVSQSFSYDDSASLDVSHTFPYYDLLF